MSRKDLILALNDAKTKTQLVQWIKKYKDIKKLQVSWYGVEPLLAFETICELTKQFKDLDLEYENASLMHSDYSGHLNIRGNMKQKLIVYV